MRHLILGFILLALLLRQSELKGTSFPSAVEATVDEIYAFADDTVKQRLAQLDASIVDHRYDPAVRRLIGMYVDRYRKGSERLLARSVAYFPYFSQQLAEKGMPDALKYLTIPESALRPYALSHVGAAGFWQLMPGTAREQGLIVNDTLDERLDLVRGTEAGLQYLLDQYDRYEDWALAMAAYNSGPGRVNRAKRRSGSSNYWKLRKYLPRETRNYVPGYIAVAYLFTYFSAHELQPKPMDPDLQITELITVHDFLSLHRVAQVTGLRPATVIELNPAYLQGYIPATKEGRTLRVPSRTAEAMRAYLNTHHTASEEPVIPWLPPRLHSNLADGREFYRQYTTYPTNVDTSAQQLAQWLGQSAHQLMIWSGIGPLDSIYQSQAWTYLKPVNHIAFGEVTQTRLPAIPSIPRPKYELKSEAFTKTPPAFLPDKTSEDLNEQSSFRRILNKIWHWIKA
ncbi:MAG: transglycosylase SLT domain-containing protein [Bacteroidota bacterium]